MFAKILLAYSLLAIALVRLYGVSFFDLLPVFLVLAFLAIYENEARERGARGGKS